MKYFFFQQKAWRSKSMAIAVLAVLIVLMVSCDNNAPQIQQELIEQEVQKKVQDFIINKKQSCRKRAIEQAILAADTLMLKSAKSFLDTATIQKPVKPTRPQSTPKVDTSAVRPLFPKEPDLSRDTSFN